MPDTGQQINLQRTPQKLWGTTTSNDSAAALAKKKSYSFSASGAPQQLVDFANQYSPNSPLGAQARAVATDYSTLAAANKKQLGWQQEAQEALKTNVSQAQKYGEEAKTYGDTELTRAQDIQDKLLAQAKTAGDTMGAGTEDYRAALNRLPGTARTERTQALGLAEQRKGTAMQDYQSTIIPETMLSNQTINEQFSAQEAQVLAQAKQLGMKPDSPYVASRLASLQAKKQTVLANTAANIRMQEAAVKTQIRTHYDDLTTNMQSLHDQMVGQADILEAQGMGNIAEMKQNQAQILANINQSIYGLTESMRASTLAARQQLVSQAQNYEMQGRSDLAAFTRGMDSFDLEYSGILTALTQQQQANQLRVGQSSGGGGAVGASGGTFTSGVSGSATPQRAATSTPKTSSRTGVTTAAELAGLDRMLGVESPVPGEYEQPYQYPLGPIGPTGVDEQEAVKRAMEASYSGSQNFEWAPPYYDINAPGEQVPYVTGHQMRD